jgi:hypothetical protein
MADTTNSQNPVYESIDALTNNQALKILDEVGRRFLQDVNETEEQDALSAFFNQSGQPVQVVDESAAGLPGRGEAAREILKLLVQIPNTKAIVLEKLDTAQEPGALGAIPLILAAPVVFTGCLVVLQIAGHVKFSRTQEGKWSVEYDPSKPTPFDKPVAEMAKAFANIIKKLSPGS